MKRKGLQIAVLAFLVMNFGIWGILLPAQYDDTFLGELKYKYDRLTEADSPKLVVVGGSAAAFGVSGQMLQQAFGDYTVVNMGMYAALGTKLMLDLTDDFFKQGDLVILMPEQQTQTLTDYVDGAQTWQALDGGFRMLRSIGKENAKVLLGTYPEFAAAKLRYVLTRSTPHQRGVYARDAFDEYGSVVCERAGNVMLGGCNLDMPIVFSDDILSEEFASLVNAYTKKAREAGATVYYHFPPMNEKAVVEQLDMDSYCLLLRETLDCPLIGSPYGSVLDAEWFYDTNFHLTSEGQLVYTEQLIRDLKAALGDSSSTGSGLGDADSTHFDHLETGAEGKAGEADKEATMAQQEDFYFAYNILAEGCELTGLTSKAGNLKELSVPEAIQGIPVVRICADTFSGMDKLRAITVPASVRQIEDGAFRGCSRLARIILENEEPEGCMVGQGLLEGTDAKIYVREECLSAYRLNYFWSVYADRIIPQE